mmetsp:Transcript_11281/g.30368  ORF Transcript_11281/g.30368 Transcript_11281/m.30368 type:complete len:110 (+) Transcript_11281:538-867(+)
MSNDECNQSERIARLLRFKSLEAFQKKKRKNNNNAFSAQSELRLAKFRFGDVSAEGAEVAICLQVRFQVKRKCFALTCTKCSCWPQFLFKAQLNRIPRPVLSSSQSSGT